MIISASRRTDIPAFYSQWFMNRIRQGSCVLVNPFNSSQRYCVDLTPDAVDAIVFWSKNPAPLLPHLGELDDMGYRYYFQFTICNYPRDIEQYLPPLSERIATAVELARRIGPRRVIWRYDPIIISSRTDAQFHRRQFASIASALEGSTTRVVVSLMDFYGKVERNLLGVLESQGWQFARTAGTDEQTRDLLRSLRNEALARGLEIQSCAEAVDMSDLGISHGKCIDDDLIRGMWGIEVDGRKDPGQRSACGCAPSRDIGANNTCIHGCRYCYATTSYRAALNRYANHDPSSPDLAGRARPGRGNVGL
jgi:hypothetical protein